MRICIFALSAIVAAPAHAEVVKSTPTSFHLRQTYTVTAPPAAAFAKFGEIAKWWGAGHTYSGDSARLSLELKPGGCFCEKLAGGGIEHMRVTYADAPKRLVLTGALGPLLYDAVAGVMDLQFEPAGTGTKITMEYKAAGFASGGADKLAPAVDNVLAEQMKSYAAFAAR